MGFDLYGHGVRLGGENIECGAKSVHIMGMIVGDGTQLRKIDGQRNTKQMLKEFFLQVTVATTLVVIAKIWKGGTGQQYDRDRKIVNFTVAV